MGWLGGPGGGQILLKTLITEIGKPTNHYHPHFYHQTWWMAVVGGGNGVFQCLVVVVGGWGQFMAPVGGSCGWISGFKW